VAAASSSASSGCSTRLLLLQDLLTIERERWVVILGRRRFEPLTRPVVHVWSRIIRTQLFRLPCTSETIQIDFVGSALPQVRCSVSPLSRQKVGPCRLRLRGAGQTRCRLITGNVHQATKSSHS
jgi:hypothetical protein